MRLGPFLGVKMLACSLATNGKVSPSFGAVEAQTLHLTASFAFI
jgi:hypothetical protein